jgi:hypothetical protein
MKLARLLLARLLLWLARAFPDVAELGRLFVRLVRIKLGRKALGASHRLADLAERLLPEDLLRR